MKINRLALSATLGLSMLAATGVVAQVNAQRHPHLAAAQAAGEKAYNELSAAQAANDFDMGGHAAKAKQLLQEANQELKMAVADSNKNAGSMMHK
jgi:hypothetical protein